MQGAVILLSNVPRPQVKTSCVTCKPKFCFLRMPELHKLFILHLDQKAAECMTCEWLYGRF